MDALFKSLTENVGKMTYQQTAKPSVIEKYLDVLPPSLLLFWVEHGWCGFGNGLFWIVDPTEFQEEMEAWIGDTDIVKQDSYHVIARSGFGDMYLWGERTGDMYRINLSHGWVLIHENREEDIEEEGSDFVLELVMKCIDSSGLDLEDVRTKEPLFDKAVETFGSLCHHEMFGFTPALFMGGELTFNSLHKVDLHIHSSLLSQFGYREILDKDALFEKAFG